VKALDEHLRNVAAAVAPHVDNESVSADLRIIELYEFADAGSAHVRNVDVTNAPVGGFQDRLAVASDPVEIDQIALGGDGPVADPPRAIRGRLRIERELHRPVGFVEQKLIGIFAGGEIFAVDGKNVVAFVGVHADFRKRRTVKLFFVLPAIDFGDAVTTGGVVEFDASAGQSYLLTLGQVVVAALGCKSARR